VDFNDLDTEVDFLSCDSLEMKKHDLQSFSEYSCSFPRLSPYSGDEFNNYKAVDLEAASVAESSDMSPHHVLGDITATFDYGDAYDQEVGATRVFGLINPETVRRNFELQDEKLTSCEFTDPAIHGLQSNEVVPDHTIH